MFTKILTSNSTFLFQFRFLLETQIYPSRNQRKPFHLALAKAEGGLDSAAAPKQSPPPPSPFNNDDTVFVGQEGVPLESVIQFENPAALLVLLNGLMALLARGDVLAFLFYFLQLKDSIMASQFLQWTLYVQLTLSWVILFLITFFFLQSEENNFLYFSLLKMDMWTDRMVFECISSLVAMVKMGEEPMVYPKQSHYCCCQILGIGNSFRIDYVGCNIRPYSTVYLSFVLVTMGITYVLLIGWRTLLISIFPS